MADKSYPMTAEGKKKLENELEELKTKKRPEVIERIKVARGFGDLSENSEYEAAKDEQSTLENRIVTIQTMLRYAEIIDAKAVAKMKCQSVKKSPLKKMAMRKLMKLSVRQKQTPSTAKSATKARSLKDLSDVKLAIKSPLTRPVVK